MLLQLAEEFVPGLCWYAADVQAIGPSPTNGRAPHPVCVGDTGTLTIVARQVVQFESGVFAGVNSRIARPRFREGGLWTDDEELADLGDSLIEYRAFDTSYWLVATAEVTLADRIRSRLTAG